MYARFRALNCAFQCAACDTCIPRLECRPTRRPLRAWPPGRLRPRPAAWSTATGNGTTRALRIRVVTPGGAVRTLAGNGEAGFADGQGAAARFNFPTALARDKDGSILVADGGNSAVRRVTMEGAVSTVAGNGEAGYADGEGAAARFKCPMDVAVDKQGTILVALRGSPIV